MLSAGVILRGINFLYRNLVKTDFLLTVLSKRVILTQISLESNFTTNFKVQLARYNHGYKYTKYTQLFLTDNRSVVLHSRMFSRSLACPNA